MAPVTEEMCKERHKNVEEKITTMKDELTEKVDEIKDEVLKIRILWSGNGHPGAGYKIDTMWECYNDTRKSTQGLVDWTFRAIITVLVTYIAIRVGLK